MKIVVDAATPKPNVSTFSSSTQPRIMESDARSRQDAVRAAGPYYHVTPVENVNGIMANGLDPAKWDRGGYMIVGMGDRPFMCLAPARNQHKYIHAIAAKTSSGRVAMLEVDADMVSQLNHELDSSNTELAMQQAALRTTDFNTLLAAGADLLCFDVIPASAIRVLWMTPETDPLSQS